MWDLDHNEGWMPKNLCFRIVVLEKTLESPLGSKDIKPVNPKGNQPWIFIGRTYAEAEALVLQLLDVKRGLTVKDPDAGKDWRQKEKGVVEDETVGWHHWLNGHEFEQTSGDSGRQTWRAAVYGVAESQTWLRDWTMTTAIGNINFRKKTFHIQPPWVLRTLFDLINMMKNEKNMISKCEGGSKGQMSVECRESREVYVGTDLSDSMMGR